MSTKRIVMACRSCGDVRTTHGRGLCGRCHHRHAQDGTLDDFATLRTGTHTRRVSHDCPWCSRNHRADTDECTACQRLEDGLDEVPNPDDALTGGRWVVIAGVHRYIRDTEESIAA